jgi:4-aminobutyrate aminotransferase-like enzyme
MGISVRDAQELIAREGVLVGGLRPGVVRIATYLGVTDDEVDQAIDAIPRALAHLVGNGNRGAQASVGTAVPRDR